MSNHLYELREIYENLIRIVEIDNLIEKVSLQPFV